MKRAKKEIDLADETILLICQLERLGLTNEQIAAVLLILAEMFGANMLRTVNVVSEAYADIFSALQGKGAKGQANEHTKDTVE